MLRAFGIGVAMLVAGQAVGIGLVCTRTALGSAASAWVIWAATIAAAFVSARTAPRWKLALGLLLAFPASILVVLLNVGSGWLGFGTDFPGVQGNLLAFKLSLWWNAVLSAVGAAEGSYPAAKRSLWSWLTNRSNRSSTLQQ